MSSNLDAVTRTGFFPHKSCPSRKRLIRGYTKIDFTVDEGKKRLNPSQDKNLGNHCKMKVDKSCVTPIGASTSLTSRINGMTTQHSLNTHTKESGSRLLVPWRDKINLPFDSPRLPILFTPEYLFIYLLRMQNCKILARKY